MMENINNKLVENVNVVVNNKNNKDMKQEATYKTIKANMHIPADTRSAFPVISVQSPVSIQCCWQS